jgi:hypothetical protein
LSSQAVAYWFDSNEILLQSFGLSSGICIDFSGGNIFGATSREIAHNKQLKQQKLETFNGFLLCVTKESIKNV